MKKLLLFRFTMVLLLFIMAACSKDGDNPTDPTDPTEPTESVILTESFTFTSGGQEMKGKIYLPDSFENKKNLPAVYLIDYEEQHFDFVADEFQQVVSGVNRISGFEALVVSLEEIPAIDAKQEKFQDYYNVYKDMALYVDNHYTSNTSRTFIGKGSEAGVVLLSLFSIDQGSSVFSNFIVTDPSHLFLEAVNVKVIIDAVPEGLTDKKLHFSFSTSSNRNLCFTFLDLIGKAQYSWLTFQYREYTNSDFNNTYPKAYADGLAYVFTK